MGDRVAALRALFDGPFFLLAVTLLVFVGAKALYGRYRFFLLHPVLVSIGVLIGVLRLLDVSYDTYREGTSIVAFLLDVSVVALAVPLYRQLAVLRRNAPGVAVGVLFGCVVGVVSAVVPFLFLGGSTATAISSAPSSVTTPIAMALSERAGGIAPLTAVIVVLTGVLGAVVGPIVLKVVGVVDRVAWGLAMGTAAHGIGTARALEQGEVEGATSSLGLCLNGLLTAAVMPLLVRLLLG